VGGIKEKVLAAHRTGVRTVVLPVENARDLDDVPEDVRADLTVVLATHVDDVLNTALHATPRAEEVRLAPELKQGGKPRSRGKNGAKDEATGKAAAERRGTRSPKAARGA
jgi:predicted ATP-dependent protease